MAFSMDTDSNYEFNAPQYIDFLNDHESEDLDHWFDENPGHEGGVRISQIDPHYEESNFKQATRAITAALQDAIIEENKSVEYVKNGLKLDPTQIEESHSENADQKINRRNTFTSASSSPMVVEAVEENVDPSVLSSGICNFGSDKQSLCSMETVPKNLVTSWEVKNVSSGAGVVKVKSESQKFSRFRRSGSMKSQRKSPLVRKDEKRRSFNERQRLTPKVQDTTKPKMDVKKPLLMIPKTPTFMRRILKSKYGQAKKTTEDLELEKINKLRKEMKSHLKKNTSYVKKALSAISYNPTRSANEITKPVEFHFATDSRIKQHPMTLRIDHTEKDFTDQLRKHPPSPTLKRGITKVVPFSFQSDVRMDKSKSGDPPAKKWESMASAVTNFYCRTPDRCKSNQGSEQNDGSKCHDNVKQKLTHPKTPLLISRNRCRPITAPSQDELEEKQVEDMKNYTFKAQQFDRRIIDADGMYGVKVQQRAPVTEIKPFSFKSSIRLEQKKQREEAKEELVPSSKQKASNSAMSSHIRTRSTEVKPFSFEERNKQLMAKKEEKIKKIFIEEEKAREFYARPLPNLSLEACVLPEVEKKAVTEPEPFNLSNDTQGVDMLRKWNDKLKKEQQAEKQKMEFKALPSKVIYEEAFKPKPSGKPLTDISSFRLNTRERSKLREVYDSKRKEQERLIEEEHSERLKVEEEEEEENVRVLRSQMVHQAKPIRTYKTVEFTGSVKPVTIPKTPEFETTKRLGRSSRV